jgi:hypothetical protein
MRIAPVRALWNRLSKICRWGIAIVNSHGRFTVFNREAKRILGMGAQQVGCAAWPETYGCYRPDRSTLYSSDRMPLARALRGETVKDELMFIRNSFQPQGVGIRTACGLERSRRSAERAFPTSGRRQFLLISEAVYLPDQQKHGEGDDET